MTRVKAAKKWQAAHRPNANNRSGNQRQLNRQLEGRTPSGNYSLVTVLGDGKTADVKSHWGFSSMKPLAIWGKF